MIKFDRNWYVENYGEDEADEAMKSELEIEKEYPQYALDKAFATWSDKWGIKCGAFEDGTVVEYTYSEVPCYYAEFDPDEVHEVASDLENGYMSWDCQEIYPF